MASTHPSSWQDALQQMQDLHVLGNRQRTAARVALCAAWFGQIFPERVFEKFWVMPMIVDANSTDSGELLCHL